MPWWEICVTLVIWRTAYVLRRSKQSAQDEHNSPQSSPSLPPTSRKPILPELDPNRTLHVCPCSHCAIELPVLLSVCRLESRPWRLTWTCESCKRLSRAKVGSDALPVLLMLDRAGGLLVSRREAERFESLDVRVLDRAVREELL
jgi:hypothetical protein